MNNPYIGDRTRGNWEEVALAFPRNSDKKLDQQFLFHQYFQNPYFLPRPNQSINQ